MTAVDVDAVSTNTEQAVLEACRRAKVASRALATATRATKDAALEAMADALVAQSERIVEANAVALDSLGRIFVGGAVTVNTGIFRAPVIITVDASGTTRTFDFGGEGGRVLALAVDSCGSVLAGLIRLQSPSPMTPIEAVVQKLAL